MTRQQSQQLVLVWALAFIVSGLLLEAYLLYHKAALISFWIATWGAAYNAFTFSISTVMGHWFGQGRKVHQWLDVVISLLIVALSYFVYEFTFTLFLSGLMAGRLVWPIRGLKSKIG